MKNLILLTFFVIAQSIYGQDTITFQQMTIKVINGKSLSYKLNDSIPFAGIVVTYFPDTHIIESSSQYKDGKLRMTESYYLNQIKKDYQTYDENGWESGDYYKWNEKGNLIIKGIYLKGNPNGTWEYYDNTGALIKKEYYLDGVLKEQ